MREFKFRGWVNDSGNFDENDEPIPMMLYGDALAFEEYMPINDMFLQIPIMQFTGLKDQNGAEIYEGDILKGETIDYLNNKKDFIKGVVSWSDEYLRWIIDEIGIICESDDLSDWCDEYLVIGNIYENAELLEKL